MAHFVEVDQSGKVEETSQDTVLAFSNGITFTVLIPATVKRNCIRALRLQGTPAKLFYFRLFAVGLFFLLKGHIEKIDQVYIDKEYMGNEGRIKDHLVNLLLRAGYAVEYHQIQFKLVGKHSAAHRLGIATLRKEKKPNLILETKDILGQFRA